MKALPPTIQKGQAKVKACQSTLNQKIKRPKTLVWKERNIQMEYERSITIHSKVMTRVKVYVDK